MDTKTQIIKVALKHICLKGYKDVSLNEIAKEVGIAKPSLYHYFKGKDEMFSEVIRYFFSWWGKWMKDIFHAETDLKTLLEKMLTSFAQIDRELMDILETKEEMRFGVYYLVFDSIRYVPRFDEIYGKNNQEMEKLFKVKVEEAIARKVISKRIDYTTIFYLFGALLEGINISRILDTTIDANRIGEKCFEIIWNGIKHPE
ncbi:MAG: TetR/AcrR family transcriptional regulator [Spirochaetes bacterium]|nr:TetR/AcrR family transcriptional regulator [Spirochaetota bacterium]